MTTPPSSRPPHPHRARWPSRSASGSWPASRTDRGWRRPVTRPLFTAGTRAVRSRGRLLACACRLHVDDDGGIAALLLQALHPLALAGVWDHSSFRTDILGRLRRTATFITGTTFGSRADALALIERVKSIHAHISGTAPDGRPYRADDPTLLTWVHVAEVSSFLAAHLRYVNPRCRASCRTATSPKRHWSPSCSAHTRCPVRVPRWPPISRMQPEPRPGRARST